MANIYEPRLQAHLALCLLKKRHLDEARELAGPLTDPSQDGEIRETMTLVNAGS